MISQSFSFITDPARWSGAGSIPQLLGAHMGYTLLAVIGAAIIALPLGVVLGHWRTGTNLVTSISGALRALPSLGLLTWLTLEMSTGVRMPIIPATIVLIILAVPPILAGTVTGMTSISRSVVDSARASGFSEASIIRSVELPLAGPSIVGGIRSATIQVLATATIVAYIGLSGLGRYLIDGLALRDYPQMLAGAFLVAVLAIAVDAAFAVLQRLIKPKGLT